MKSIRIPALAAILVLTTGCNGSSSTGPAGGGPGGSSTFTATVDGVAWTADVVTAVRQSGVVVVTGADASVFSVQISFLDTSGSPIPIDGTTAANGVIQENSVFWSTALPGATGTIEVTELTSAGVQGTFSLTTGANSSATPAVRVITNGTFDVTF